jgi:hypothetical protein
MGKEPPAEGIYTDQFRERELQDLEAFLASGLQDEISMLRVMIRRVMEYSNGVEDLETAVGVLGALGSAAQRLSGLLKTQREMALQNNEMGASLSEALAQVLEELKNTK